MSSKGIRYLDQAHDLLAFYFEGTAEGYDRYLQGEYNLNRESHRLSWDNHYASMRGELLTGIKQVIENTGVKRGELNLALVGPGFRPTQCEIDRRFVEEQLVDFNSVVLIDFSQRVLVSAAEDLIKAGISPAKIFKMQFDITNGMSTVYKNFIRTMFSEVDTEEKLGRVAETCEEFDVDSLRDRLSEERERAEDSVIKPTTTTEIGGGPNKDRRIELSIEGESLPLHLISYQMVLAGTGASAEDLIWTVYNDTVKSGECPDSEEVRLDRKKMFRRLHKLICDYNTEIAATTIDRFIVDNPNALVMAVTDTSTISEEHKDDFDRIDRKKLQKKLEVINPQIEMSTPRHSWNWKDEDEHSHDVRAFEFRLSQAV